MRTIIIGDIHGCFQELTALLEMLDFQPSKDCLISLGDLIDRGEQPFEVFDFFRRMKLQMRERCVIIRGNHEQMMMDAYYDSGVEEIWRMNGNSTTVRSFKSHRDDIHRHIRWFQENTVLYYTAERFQCAHAGLRDEVISRNRQDTLLWDRESMRENTYKGKLTIVGHTPIWQPTHFTGRQGIAEFLSYGQKQPLPAAGIIGLDTGCVFKRSLTAMVIQGGEYQLEYVAWTGKRLTGQSKWVGDDQKTGSKGFWKRLVPGMKKDSPENLEQR